MKIGPNWVVVSGFVIVLTMGAAVIGAAGFLSVSASVRPRSDTDYSPLVVVVVPLLFPRVTRFSRCSQ